MEIIYFQEKDKPLEVNFRYWDNINSQKFYLTPYNSSHFIPECGEIPEECRFYFAASKKSFEDAVIELADKIRSRRSGDKHPEIVHMGSAAISSVNVDRLVGIIEKLVER